jgi:hypothetical protein
LGVDWRRRADVSRNKRRSRGLCVDQTGAGSPSREARYVAAGQVSALLPIDFHLVILKRNANLKTDASRLGSLRTSEIIVGIVVRVAGVTVDSVVDAVLLNKFAHFEPSEAVFSFSLW